MTTLEQVLNEIDCIGWCTTFRDDLKKFDPKKPCFGFTLQNGILIIAIIDVVSKTTRKLLYCYETFGIVYRKVA